ncbi:hypothetical protein ACX93W_26205 [Paenibacillus sp. CAU 1782]
MRIIFKGLRYILLILLVTLGPVLTNALIQFSFSFPDWVVRLLPYYILSSSGDGDTWIGFFGNYSGGIIGGIFAYLIAKTQINEEKKRSEASSRVDQKNILDIIKLDLLLIVEAYDTLSKQKLNSNISLGYYPRLNSDVWSKVSLISDITLQTNLIQIYNIYNDVVDSLATDIDSLIRLQKQVDKTIFKINSIGRKSVDEELNLVQLMNKSYELNQLILQHQIKRGSIYTLIKEKKYIEKIKSLNKNVANYQKQLEKNK